MSPRHTRSHSPTAPVAVCPFPVPTRSHLVSPSSAPRDSCSPGHFCSSPLPSPRLPHSPHLSNCRYKGLSESRSFVDPGAHVALPHDCVQLRPRSRGQICFVSSPSPSDGPGSPRPRGPMPGIHSRLPRRPSNLSLTPLPSLFFAPISLGLPRIFPWVNCAQLLSRLLDDLVSRSLARRR